MKIFSWRFQKTFVVLVMVGLWLTSWHRSADAKRVERMALAPSAMAEITSILNAGDSLHGAYFKQDDEQVEVALRDLEVSIKRAIAVTGATRSTASVGGLKPHEQFHLLKILEPMQENIEVARNSSHTERRDRVAELFNIMANLVRIYAVDARFKIFFCRKDHLTWVQTANRGQYPFVDTNERDCALRAP